VSVTFHIPGTLRDFTGGRTQVEIEASPGVLGDALKALWTRYPGIRDRITTEQGQIRQHINVFVGNEDIRYTGGLATPIRDGSEISIVPAVSGGLAGSISRVLRVSP
jgi:molybdopterin synthase sulfur carrier subunit